MKGKEEREGSGQGGTGGSKTKGGARIGLAPEKESSRQQEQPVQRPGGGPLKSLKMEGLEGSERGEGRPLLQASPNPTSRTCFVPTQGTPPDSAWWSLGSSVPRDRPSSGLQSPCAATRGWARAGERSQVLTLHLLAYPSAPRPLTWPMAPAYLGLFPEQPPCFLQAFPTYPATP